MSKLSHVSLSAAEDLESLRRSVENELNRLVVRINDSIVSEDINMNNKRIKFLKRPAEALDAVNVQYLREELKASEKKMRSAFLRPNLRLAYGYNDEEFQIVPGGFSVTGAVLSSFVFAPTHFTVSGTTVDLKTGGIDNTVVGTGAIMTPNLYAGAILVGGGTNRPTQFTIYDHDVNAVGWIGDDYGNSGYSGAWFKRVLVGGTSPATAKFFADAKGNTVMKSVYVYNTAGTVGWIGNNGIHTGGWFKQLYVGGTDAASAPMSVDSDGDISFVSTPTHEVSFSLTNAGSDEVAISNGTVSVLNSGGNPYTTIYDGIVTVGSNSSGNLHQNTYIDYTSIYNTHSGSANPWVLGSDIAWVDSNDSGIVFSAVSPSGFRACLSGYGGLILRTSSLNTTDNILIDVRDSTPKIEMTGGTPYIDLNDGEYKISGTVVINTDCQFVGPGVVTTTGGVGGVGFNVYQSGWNYGVTGPSTFTSADGKVIVVRGGIITSIT